MDYNTAEEFDNYVDLILTSHALENISRQTWDAIVIGSGMGGLTAAAALSKGGGEKVLLLEKHTKLGGTTHEFRHHGIDFDTGLHYVGGEIWKKNSVARKMFDWITDDKLEWEPLDEVYDVAIVDGERFDMRSGIGKQKVDLKKRFPEFSEQLDAYWREVEDQANHFAEFIKRQIALAYFPDFTVPKDKSFGQETVAQALDRLNITDKKLRDVLTYLHGDYGAVPEEASWVQHCMVISHYSPGAAYPVGGPGKIARLVLAVIERSGGRAATRAKVDSIVIEKGKAVGVIVKGDKMIRAHKVISAVGAYHTFTKLVPQECETEFPFLEKARASLLSEEVKMSPSHAMTFLVVKGTAESLGLPKANWWIQDHERFESVFISFPSAKDPTWATRYPDVSVCEIVVEAEFELFEAWKKDPVKNRSPEYIKLKEELADEMCEILFKHFPQLRDKVDFREASTPLSSEHFLGSKKGCAYGIACTPARYRAKYLKPATDIKNLYIGAQDVVSCGIVGSQMGGLVSACCASFKTLMKFGYIFSTDRMYLDTREQWSLQDEVDVVQGLF